MTNGPISETENTPTCVGVIMDGNRRWAKERGLTPFLGHTEGYKKFKEFIGWAKEQGVKYVIAYAFSTENWKRSKDEIDHLMGLLRNVLDNELAELKKEGVRLRFIGETEKFPNDIVEKLKNIEEETVSLSEIEVLVALSYGGRSEIISAIKKCTPEEIKDLNEKNFSQHLFTKNIPDPDLVIRTGGEVRLSNFLLWQTAYSELYFTDLFFPDFSPAELEKAVKEFQDRQRRFGK